MICDDFFVLMTKSCQECFDAKGSDKKKAPRMGPFQDLLINF